MVYFSAYPGHLTTILNSNFARVRICTSHDGTRENAVPLQVAFTCQRSEFSSFCSSYLSYKRLLLPFQALPAVTCAPVIRCTQVRATSLFTLRRSDSCLFRHRSKCWPFTSSAWCELASRLLPTSIPDGCRIWLPYCRSTASLR